MKTINLLLSCTCFLFACKGKNSSTTEQTSMQADTTIRSAAIAPEMYTDLYGNWVGDNEVTERDEAKFKGQEISRLNIIIKQITDSGVIAQSIVNGNSRLMRGSVTKSNNNYEFVMNEPGDDKYDGRFEFTIAGDTLSGKWQPFDT
ncbi:MAG: hypothetical protein EOO13_16195, partial [Chitinophagaceae bacterium]